MKRILILLTILSGAALFGARPAAAQHTVGFTFGSGMGTGRFEPQQETRPVWGIFTGGLSWRYYTAQRVVGCIGADLEFLQRAFSMATNASRVDDPKDYLYYTRRVNSIVLPIVWQPHAYLARRRLRLYGEAGVTFSYNLSSEWEREYLVDGRVETEKGDYTMRTVRDNRWGYGLVGAAAPRCSSDASKSTCAPATTSATRTSCATATSTAGRSTALRPRRCARRSTTSRFRSA